jgi:acyl-coenzyme A thioesterase PaaI-like protein
MGGGAVMIEAETALAKLQAGLVGALIDTACGFAAATITEGVLASHYSVNFFRPAVATRFIAQGKILKLGKRQIFCRAEVYGDAVTDKRLVASGETILMAGS